MVKQLFILGLVILSLTTTFAQKVKSLTITPYAKEVQSLAKNKSVEEAFRIITVLEPSTIKGLIDLTEIPSPPFKENTRALKMKELFEKYGADKVMIDSIGNVLAWRFGKKSTHTVVLDAHLDTVFPEGTDVTIRHHGDTLYAPGVSDDTRGLQNILTVLQALEKAKIETNEDLLFLASVGEEGLGDLRGVKYLLSHNQAKIASWISVDGTEFDKIVTRALGSVRYKVTINGPGGHSWSAFGLGNPHHAMAKSLNYFADAAAQFTAAVGQTSFNVGRTGGGTSVNAIPFESWAEIDMRAESPEKLKKIDSILKVSMKRGLEEYNKHNIKGPALTLTIKQIGYRPSGQIDISNPIVQRAKEVVSYFGQNPSFIVESTNANIALSKGIPAITIGAGGKSNNAHSLHEWWLNEKGDEGIKFVLLMTLAETGIANETVKKK